MKIDQHCTRRPRFNFTAVQSWGVIFQPLWQKWAASLWYFFCVTELDWPKSIMQQKKKKLRGSDCFRTGDQSQINVPKIVFTVRDALKTASFCLVDCGTAFCHCWVSGNLLCVTVHLCKCVGTCVCVSMFECNCVLWSDRLQFRMRAAVKLFHWNDPTGSQPHRRSRIQRFYTITLAHSPLAWFNRSPNDWKHLHTVSHTVS